MATILLVEDNRLNMELSAEILQITGHTVLAAASAEEGITIAQQSVPDLILMDIALPRMDGLQAVKLIRSDSRLRFIPVVALTAYAMKGDKERALMTGFDGYITKPIDAARFVDEIQKYLDSQEIAASG